MKCLASIFGFILNSWNFNRFAYSNNDFRPTSNSGGTGLEMGYGIWESAALKTPFYMMITDAISVIVDLIMIGGQFNNPRR